MNVDLSVVIPVYNAMPLLERTLDSIFTQTTNYSYEVILVDDGSKDNSVEYIKSRPEQNIILIQQKNAGPAAARNNGVNHASGRYCAYLDADDYWIDGFIEKTVLFLDNHQECVAVNVGQKHITISGEGYSPKCINEYKEPFVLDDFFAFWGKYMHVCTGSVCMRTNIMKECGGQRTDLRITEDLEFWALLSTYGKWGFIPELLFVSDGTDLVKDQASWMRKMMPRWKNAPSIEDWQKRIVQRIDTTAEGYKQALGKIASQLVYGHIMSSRTNLARKQVKLYGIFFPKSLSNKVFVVSSKNILLWHLQCTLLRFRENHRFK